ncbi:MAG: hypothetical protein Q9227_009393 [Pyrenula ochraceoflavens]
MDDLKDLARRMLSNGPQKTLPTSKRIRIRFNNQFIIDTTSATYVWESEKYPQYYILQSALPDTTTVSESLEDGKAALLTLPVGSQTISRILSFSAGPLSGLVKIDFSSPDQWYEEDTPIYVHPRDPFKRIDILTSTRPLKISLNGVTLATTNISYHLFETSLPTRYYIPSTSITDWSLLKPSALRTQCPYKGEAEYYSVVLPSNDGGEKEHNDLVWYYTRPLLECTPVAGCLCFYNEKVDIELDGKMLERPVSYWS